MSDHIPTMGDSSRSVTSICGLLEDITPIGVRVPHNPLRNITFLPFSNESAQKVEIVAPKLSGNCMY